MSNSANLLLDRLRAALEPHGAVSDFCRKTGLARRTVENWLSGRSYPGLESLDAIARGLGKTPAELLAESKPLRLVAPADTRLALFGSVVSRLAAFNESQLRFLLPYVDAASELGGSGKDK